MSRNRRYRCQWPKKTCSLRDIPLSSNFAAFPVRQNGWRSLFVGYPMALVFTGAVFLLVLWQRALNIGNYFVGAPLIFVVLLVGWIWGIGPACLALFAGVLMIDYWILPPTNAFTLVFWPDAFTILLLLGLQAMTLYLVAIHKRNQQQLFLTKAEATMRAQELAQSNVRLAQANRSKDEFFSRASHELKTPLTTIRGHAQLALRRLSRQPPLPAEYAYLFPYLERIETQTHFLRLLVDDLLDLSSLRTGKMPLHREPCDVNRLCRDLTGDLGTLAERPIDLHLPPEPLIIMADEGRLSQVMSNLVANALKYSPEHSLVRVEAHRTATQVILSVYNEGTAIPPVQQKELFEPFYRSPGAQSSPVPGWGLGLAISKAIIDQHEGRIWIESSEETGTTFIVALPFAPGEQEL